MVVNDLLSSFQKRQKRNIVKDSKRFLEESGIIYKISGQNNLNTNTPSLIAVNHFCRPLTQRRTPTTTIDSLVSASIVATATQTSKRKITWVTRDNLASTFPFKFTKLRKVQLAAHYCYNLIGASKNYPFSNIESWIIKLKSGYNIAFFPEGRPSAKLQPPNKNFIAYLKDIKSEIPSIQIVPASIFFEKGVFHAHFSTPIRPKKITRDTILKIMYEVALKIPQKHKGVYS